MNKSISLFNTPLRITTSTGFPNLWAARDLLNYNQLDIEFKLLGWEGATSPSLQLGLSSGWQRETTSGWITSSPTTVTFSGTSTQQAGIVHMNSWHLRYVGIRVFGFSGATAADIWVRGMARCCDV